MPHLPELMQDSCRVKQGFGGGHCQLFLPTIFKVECDTLPLTDEMMDMQL